jgi:hypothetical protein
VRFRDTGAETTEVRCVGESASRARGPGGSGGGAREGPRRESGAGPVFPWVGRAGELGKPGLRLRGPRPRGRGAAGGGEWWCGTCAHPVRGYIFPLGGRGVNPARPAAPLRQVL